MNSSKLALALAFGVVVGAQTANAGVPPVSTTSTNTDTAFSIGLQYDFGDAQPDVVGSVRRTITDTDNDVTGGKLDVAIPITAGNYMPTVRAMGIAGSTDVQGEFGLGYDLGSTQALVAGGVQGPYVNGGVNYELDGTFAPYIGVNTLKEAPSRNTDLIPPP